MKKSAGQKRVFATSKEGRELNLSRLRELTRDMLAAWDANEFGDVEKSANNFRKFCVWLASELKKR